MSDEANQTCVVNVHDEECDIYIGRTVGKEWVDVGWGNPFKLGTPGIPRRIILELYRAWVIHQPDLMSRLDEIRGKRLGCWCAPLPCHGDVLVELVEGLNRADRILSGEEPIERLIQDFAAWLEAPESPLDDARAALEYVYRHFDLVAQAGMTCECAWCVGYRDSGAKPIYPVFTPVPAPAPKTELYERLMATGNFKPCTTCGSALPIDETFACPWCLTRLTSAT